MRNRIALRAKAKKEFKRPQKLTQAKVLAHSLTYDHNLSANLPDSRTD